MIVTALEPFRGRTVDPDRAVSVYRNLHNRCYSVTQRGRVVAHARTLRLKDVTFLVREAGRQRVLAEKKKNVHAFVKGHLVSDTDTDTAQLDLTSRVSYNPYKAPFFVCGDARVDRADAVSLNDSGCWARPWSGA